MEDYSWWCELPEDLQEKALAWLPLKFVGRFCSVSQEWNSLLASTRFIRTVWAQTPPNRNPWLVEFSDFDSCFTYSFIKKIWDNRVSFSFLEENAPAIPGYRVYRVNCLSAAAGLCIMNLEFSNTQIQTPPIEEIFLCNPLTQTSLRLPRIPSRESIGIMAGEGGSFKVVAFSEWRDGGHMKVSIYDPSLKQWTIAGQLPRTLKLVRNIFDHTMVSSKSSVYCVAEIKRGLWRIVGFNIGDGTSVVIPLPELTDNRPKFIACGAKLLLVGYIYIDVEVEVQDVEDEDELRDEYDQSEFEDEDEIQDVDEAEDGLADEDEYESEFDDEYSFEKNVQLVIWEFQENMVGSSNSAPSSLWKEIARMPSSLWEDLRERDIITEWPWCFDQCVGAGDYVLFLPWLGRLALSYNLSEQSWEEFESHEHFSRYFAFEPRPDVKIQ